MSKKMYHCKCQLVAWLLHLPLFCLLCLCKVVKQETNRSQIPCLMCTDFNIKLPIKLILILTGGKLHQLNNVNYTLGLNNNSSDAILGPCCLSPWYILGSQ